MSRLLTNATSYYARIIGVNPDKDSATMRGVYLTVADLKHIVETLKYGRYPSKDAEAWTRDLLAYIGDPNRAR